jgi:hypothetical protein
VPHADILIDEGVDLFLVHDRLLRFRDDHPTDRLARLRREPHDRSRCQPQAAAATPTSLRVRALRITPPS